MNVYADVGIIGAGPAGVFAAMNIVDMSDLKVCVFDAKQPLSTLLPTGGGKCNLSYYEPDIGEFVLNYPRGAKFLYSVFYGFDVNDTLNYFEKRGVKTYVRDDNKIFPVSNSSHAVAETMLKYSKNKGIKFIKQKIISVTKETDIFVLKSSSGEYHFKKLLISTGGKDFSLAKSLGHDIVEPRPSLVPLCIKEKEFYDLTGVSLKDISIKAFFEGKKTASAIGDFLFTAKSVSGPVIYKISSICAFKDFSSKNPVILKLNLTGKTDYETEEFITKFISSHPNSKVKNMLSMLIPTSLGIKILERENIPPDKETVHLKISEKRQILEALQGLELTVTGRLKHGEIVTAGGVNLDEINSKTMESKIVPGLFFAGEVTNIDGFTGGFNLQNCWSTAGVAAKAICEQ